MNHREAKSLIEALYTHESKVGRTYGGHKHTGAGNPLITEFPLPRGWRRKCEA